MSFFTPPQPKRSAPVYKRGERGSRGTVSSTVSVEDDLAARASGRRRKERPNKEAGLEARGFLLGDGPDPRTCRWYYDLDGKYVRVRGRMRIVERFGPERALRALTEDERAEVMRARRRYREAEERGTPQRGPQGRR